MTGVLALTTGGTIDKVYTVRGNLEIGESCLPAVLSEGGVSVEVQTTEVLRKDSLDVTPRDRDELRRRVAAAPQRHILITHGTDTMVETARILSDLSSEKTIVLTGATQPQSMRHSDAAFNVGFALAALSLLPHGVYIAMNGRVFAADQVQKDRSTGRFVGLD